MAEIHNTKKRMPVILTPENEKLWLSGNDVMQFAMPDINLEATTI
jgi:putative SOS response-associated peptidase YedK